MNPAAAAAVPATQNGSPEQNGSAEAPYRELLALDRIVKRWGKHIVLDHAELILEPSSLTWIAGANGVGKTTLLRIAAGLIAPDSGIVDLEGLHPERQRNAYLRQVGFLSAGEGGLYPRLTVQRHLEFWARLAMIPKAERQTAIERVVEHFGLHQFLKRRVERMSMGQRQRVRLGMTFLHDPRVVLLDEPLNSLDEEGSELVAQSLHRVVGQGGAVVWCSPGSDRPPVEFDARYRLVDGRLESR